MRILIANRGEIAVRVMAIASPESATESVRM